MAKRIALNRIKKNQSYTVLELATVTRVSEPIVRGWIENGLQVIDAQRPTLIMGFIALQYLEKTKSQIKRPMQLHEVYCFRCKAPRAPLGMMADYIPQSSSGGRLVALCADCECICNRSISFTQLPEIEEVLDIVKRGGK